MKTAKLLSLLLPVVLGSAVSAMAGDSGYTERTYTATTQVQAHRCPPVAVPFCFLGRAWETFLHSPQILSEGIEGDRALVNRRGILAPREIPVEDRIISPQE